MVNSWWNARTSREQKIIKIGGIAIAILFFYHWVWSPLTQSVHALMVQRQQQTQLLSWLRQASPRLSQLQAQGYRITPHANQALLSTIEASAQKAKLQNSITRIQMTQSQQIAVSMQSVPFDLLSHWLTSLQQQQQIMVKQAHLDRATPTGTVNATLLLQTARFVTT